MKNLMKYLQENPHVAVLVVSFICFAQFITSIFNVLRGGRMDDESINHLLASVDGIEAVMLFLIMLGLQNKKK
jgi:hypothetical protein